MICAIANVAPSRTSREWLEAPADCACFPLSNSYCAGYFLEHIAYVLYFRKRVLQVSVSLQAFVIPIRSAKNLFHSVNETPTTSFLPCERCRKCCTTNAFLPYFTVLQWPYHKIIYHHSCLALLLRWPASCNTFSGWLQLFLIAINSNIGNHSSNKVSTPSWWMVPEGDLSSLYLCTVFIGITSMGGCVTSCMLSLWEEPA